MGNHPGLYRLQLPALQRRWNQSSRRGSTDLDWANHALVTHLAGHLPLAWYFSLGSGTRLKILEAMALGVPVVSTSKGAEGLDVVDGQHLLIADDPAEFVAKMQAALHDAVLRDHLITQARQLVEQYYNWRTIGQQFVKLVESTANSYGHRS